MLPIFLKTIIGWFLILIAILFIPTVAILDGYTIRAVQHFVGYIGVAILFLCAIEGTRTRVNFIFQLYQIVPITIFAFVLLLINKYFLGTLSVAVFEIALDVVTIGIIFGGLYLGLSYFVIKKKNKLWYVSYNIIDFLFIFLCYSMSFAWEIGMQTKSIQYAQILADICGITLGLFIYPIISNFISTIKPA